jgi:uncharacterized DUF497 family protein
VAIEFEWDEAKAESNYSKHGVSFELAVDVFKDVFAIEFSDDRKDYGEERFVIVGIVDGNLLSVIYTERQDVIRLISARRATKNEQAKYFNQNPETDDSRRN